MALRYLVALGATMLLVAVAAPAHAATSFDAPFQPDDARPERVSDSSIVVAGEPTRACAAPAFVQPIDRVAAPPLAATGIGPALQVVALTALAAAGLMAPRRRRASDSTWLSPRSHEDEQG